MKYKEELYIPFLLSDEVEQRLRPIKLSYSIQSSDKKKKNRENPARYILKAEGFYQLVHSMSEWFY